MAEFVWAKGSRLTKKTADPQVIGDTLDQLQRDNGGRITARVVVESARPLESTLHPCFEWDDVRAAELFREDQARHVISSIRVVHASADPRQASRVIHAYVNLEELVGDEIQRAYIPLARVFESSELLKQALERAGAELRAFEDRYTEFDLIARVARTAREELEHVAATQAA